MNAKKDVFLVTVLLGALVLSAWGCARKNQQPEMIDVASRLEQARAQRAAYDAQQTQMVQPAKAAPMSSAKPSYIK